MLRSRSICDFNVNLEVAQTQRRGDVKTYRRGDIARVPEPVKRQAKASPHGQGKGRGKERVSTEEITKYLQVEMD